MRLVAVKKYLVFNTFQCIRRSFQTTGHLWHNIEKDHEHLKTSVHFITHPKEKFNKQKPSFVTRYGPKGFVVQGSRVIGSLVILPGILLHWKVKSSEEITAESLELFAIFNPTLDILVIGTGDRVVRLDKSVHEAVRRKGIALEIQDTPNACATYNFLLDEGRITGAALIPPSHLQS